ncbi:MaoC/PaaZ C-terminal domain-containing protein [Rhodopseudomonas palustris]|uniref:MaoC-like dehydratase n=1 Tax=Rhodopseudomonas palustris (strain BisB18) TaxID=316056 RepID=Q21AH1_RHOPB
MRLQVDRPLDLAALVGQELPPSETFALTQSDVDRFVALSQDRQWIHCDTERAKAALPTGRTIVPGNLLIAQLPRLLQQAYTVARCDMSMVAEYRRVRFRHPVGTEVPLFLQARFVSVTPTRSFVRVETNCEINFAETRKPVLTATVVDLFYDSG